ncbi:autophagy-related protein 17 [Chaetomidium leptoderma]|uniref:Autophagy-related protein 17 n=1 Tax=Chaetomidium leptoderma TaxID=669021 RepID=A0AAN6VFE1_9PEZI|nr:autophagy-related protein 17 [Chaetomidium leptoderma]
MASSSSASSAEAHSRPTSPLFDPHDVPVEVLVRYLLAAKQSLSSMGLVLRANDLATHARQMYEESVILGAQTGFLRRLIDDEIRLLRKLRKGMALAYNTGSREFKPLLRTLDAADGKLEKTMRMLRETYVEPVFRPRGEEKKCLMDFVDEHGVESMRDELKGSIAGLQAAQTSFDGDLLRYDDDLRLLNKTLTAAPSPDSPSSSSDCQPIPHLLSSLSENSHILARFLTDLNTHFDECVKAVRATEGGAALARRRAAEATDDGEPVSISGFITEQESHSPDLEPMDPQELAHLVRMVIKDAAEADVVVGEIQKGLVVMERDFGMLKEQADRIRGVWMATLAAAQVLEDIESRLHSYVAAEHEFLQRRADEKDIISRKLEEMDGLRKFYEGYARAYSSLLLEVERRRAVEDKMQNTLRKAKENLDNLAEADRKQREHFRQEVGEFLPTDLWVGMNSPLRRWELVPVKEGAGAKSEAREEASTPTLGKASTPTLGKASTPTLGRASAPPLGKATVQGNAPAR